MVLATDKIRRPKRVMLASFEFCGLAGEQNASHGGPPFQAVGPVGGYGLPPGLRLIPRSESLRHVPPVGSNDHHIPAAAARRQPHKRSA
jgi:hypothetical protein